MMDFNMSRGDVVETKMDGPVHIFPSQRLWLCNMWNDSQQTSRGSVMFLRNLFGLIIILLLISCVNSVNLDYDELINFKGMQTFRLLDPPQKKSGDVRLDTPLVDKRIRQAIEHTLIAKDCRKVETGADFEVAYQLSVKHRVEGGSSGISLGVGTYSPGSVFGMRYGYPVYDVKSYEEGVLTIDILSGPDRQLIWRGSRGRRLYDGSTPEKMTKYINKLVDEILQHFPPGPSK
jgi:hypothetical protein